MTSKTPEPESLADPNAGGGMYLWFRQRRVLLYLFLACVFCEACLLLLDYHINTARWIDISQIRRFTNLTREDALGSWFAVTQTALVAVTLWVIFLTVKQRGCPSVVRVGWLILALFFSYMAMDDGTKFHERMGSAFKEVQREATQDAGSPTWGRRLLDVSPSYSWQVLFLPMFGALGLFMLGFLWFVLNDWFSRLLTILGLSCFVCAVSLDFIEGLDKDHAWNVYTRISNEYSGVEVFTKERFGKTGFDALRHFSKAIEESLEMFGMTLFWVIFVRHWTSLAENLHLQFKPARRKAE